MINRDKAKQLFNTFESLLDIGINNGGYDSKIQEKKLISYFNEIKDFVFDKLESLNIANQNEKLLCVPTLSELLDKLSILQLKEVRIPENREQYKKDIQDVLHDIDLILNEKQPKIDAKFLRNLIILSHYNNHIWYNESAVRNGSKDPSQLVLTHSLNGIRNKSKNNLEEYVTGKKDLKVDCLAAEYSDWEPSW